jgi:hypothetical protein
MPKNYESPIWSYRTDVNAGDLDLVGYDVEASDGGIGKIDESNPAAGRAHLVVDTGFWIFGKKRLIPAGVVQRVDHDDRTVYVNMTKDAIKSAPDFDETKRDELDRYNSYYDTVSH